MDRRLIWLVPVLVLTSVLAFAQDTRDPQMLAMGYVKEGIDFFALGNYEKARELFQKSVSTYDNLIEGHWWLGRACAQEALKDARLKIQAVDEFRKVLQISPYGEIADQARAWLLKLLGRSNKILLLPTLDYATLDFEQRDTLQKVLNKIEEQIQNEAKYTLVKVDFWSNLPKDTLEAINLARVQEAGWILLVWSDKVQIEEVIDKKGRVDYNPTLSASVEIVDPIFAESLPKFSLQTDRLLNILFDWDSPWKAQEDAIQNIAQHAWQRSKTLLEQYRQFDPKLCQEITLPTSLPSVLAKTRVTDISKAMSLPILTLYCWDDTDNLDLVKDSIARLGDKILDKYPLSIVSSSQISKVYHPKENFDILQLCSLCRQIPSDYLLIFRLKKVEYGSYSRLFGLTKKIFMTVEIKVELFSTLDGKVLLQKEYSCQKGQKRIRGPVEDKKIRLINEAMEEILGKICADLSLIFSPVPAKAP